MPNWVTNTLRINYSNNEEHDIIKSWIDKDGNFDFNKIIPMPESLQLDEGTKKDISLTYYLTERLTKDPISVNLQKYVNNMFNNDWASFCFKKTEEWVTDLILGNAKGTDIKTVDDLYELGKKYFDNIQNYGHATWYVWALDNWGTKWNACDTDIEELEDSIIIHFDTAWSVPDKILEAICKKWPNLEWSDDVEEESGEFSGILYPNPDPKMRWDFVYEDLLEERWGPSDDIDQEDDENNEEN